jgi:multisubunit Na+/H+ antiporter MnhE subunit
MKCGIVAAGVFMLWLLLAGEITPATLAAGVVVAAAVSAWALLLDG